MAVAFSRNGQLLASSSEDGTLILRDFRTRRILGQPLSLHTEGAIDLEFTPDGQSMITVEQDGLRLWDLATRQPIGGAMSIGGSFPTAIHFDSKSESALCVDLLGMLSKWDLSTNGWRNRALRVADRNLSQAEWEQFLPGLPYHKLNPTLPIPREYDVNRARKTHELETIQTDEQDSIDELMRRWREWQNSKEGSN